jgi:hypothetical protein
MTDEFTDMDAFNDWAQALSTHVDHSWSQVGLCVYCADCGVRLYDGSLPDEKRTTPKCAPGGHEWDDGNSMSQCGFYLLCLRCGEQEWTE